MDTGSASRIPELVQQLNHNTSSIVYSGTHAWRGGNLDPVRVKVEKVVFLACYPEQSRCPLRGSHSHLELCGIILCALQPVSSCLTE